MNSIFPSSDPAAKHDQRVKDLINYARKLEKDMFENADDTVSEIMIHGNVNKNRSVESQITFFY